MKKKASEKFAKQQRREIAALAEEKIDTSDIPEILDWSGAKRGLLYRPVKQQITLRLDADVIAWFKEIRLGDGDTKLRSIASSANMPD